MIAVCEGCGEVRKVFRTEHVVVCGELDDVFNFCFICVKESERAERKAELAELMRDDEQ